MDTHRTIRQALLAAVLGAIGVTGIALAENEVEPNNPISSPQPLTITTSDATIAVSAIGGNGSGTVRGIVGKLDCPNPPPNPLPEQWKASCLDADFYSFWGKENDVVTIDIDGGLKPAGGGRSVDTVIFLFRPGLDYKILAWSDDVPLSQPIDEGSTSRLDSRIDSFTLPVSGTYIVGVTGFPIKLGDGGTYTRTDPQFRSIGEYTLIVSGVTPAEQHISIEIKPGSGEYAPINPKSQGNIPVALLSSSEFDALTVDPTTLTFGATGDEKSWLRCGKGGEDVDGDGRLDLVCHFGNRWAHFDTDDTMGIVKGKTKPEAGGTPFVGRGMLKVVPVKRQQD